MFDIQKLKEICERDKKDFPLPYYKMGNYYYKDNNSNILAVAHLDSVLSPTKFDYAKFQYSKQKIVISPVLDDRLGVYIILEVLPKLGLKYDILLTDDEEIVRSTAGNFKTSKKYNWMFMFDRRGNDVVTYNYNAEGWHNALKEYFDIGIGSYSCIKELEHLGCCGVNIGTSYYDNHSYSCYASLTELRKTIDKFIKFYQKNKDKRYTYEKKALFSEFQFSRWRML